MRNKKSSEINKRKYRRYFIMALSLAICLSAVSAIATKAISDLAVSSCFRELQDSTVQYAADIRTDIEYDLKLLEVIADNMTKQNTLLSGEKKELFTLSKAGILLDEIVLILPDGRMYADDEACLEQLKAVSYTEEAAAGAHVSGRIEDREKPGKFYLYYFVPVVKDGETKGLLCGIIDLDTLKQRYTGQLAEETSFQLLEGGSGAFLIDSIHSELGNKVNFRNRTAKKGYGMEQVMEDIEGGNPGKTAFFSRSKQEYIYCVYEPVGINDWMIMLGQPENIVLGDAENIRFILRHFIIFETTVFLLYLLFVFWEIRKTFREREKELGRVQYILKIEEILFNAARSTERIGEALSIIAKKHSAQYAFFIIYNENGTEKMYTWGGTAQDVKDPYSKEDFPVLCSRLLCQGRIIYYDKKEMDAEGVAEYQKLRQLGISSLMSIPVDDPDHAHIGTLGVANMGQRFSSTELLDCVMLSFSMAVKNIISFREAEEMGIRDKLTGLKNRNSYQSALESYENNTDSNFFCIYVDADGLHDINNQYGHEAGDNLLKTVAKVIKEEFGDEDTYRIGGDEFVAFCNAPASGQVKQKIRNAKKRIEEKGYHISVGMESMKNKPFIYEMVKQAERNMFEAKRCYHEDTGDIQNIRGMNRKLEKTLMEKRDLDVFRSVLSSKYLGVYIVDLKIDTFRYIYIPSYFDAAAEQSGGKFSEAVKIYVETFVLEEYRQPFLKLLDYDNVEKRLNGGEEPELLYRRPDGVEIMLKIYLSPEYGEDCWESIWTFEKV